MATRKYTAEILRPAVEKAFSYAEVLRHLGLKQTGGSQAYIKRLIQQYELRTEHFLGQARNRGNGRLGGPKKIAAKEILVRRDLLAHPEKAHKLRRAMIEIGIPYCCEQCGLTGEWNGRPMMLTVDHIDGQRTNNEKDNLRFLCPNCHSQTANFGQSLGLTDVTTCKRRAAYYRQKMKAAGR